MQACENEFSISYVKTLILNAALEAAIMTVPRLFIADCTTMFETANTALCIPAGSPICNMLQNRRVNAKPFYFSEKELFSVFHDISLNKKLYLTNIMFV